MRRPSARLEVATKPQQRRMSCERDNGIGAGRRGRGRAGQRQPISTEAPSTQWGGQAMRQRPPAPPSIRECVASLAPLPAGAPSVPPPVTAPIGHSGPRFWSAFGRGLATRSACRPVAGGLRSGASMTDIATRKYAGKTRTRGRPFAAGNPGRPRDSRNRTTCAVEALLALDLAGIVSVRFAFPEIELELIQLAWNPLHGQVCWGTL
jgi:hypothetical protein